MPAAWVTSPLGSWNTSTIGFWLPLPNFSTICWLFWYDFELGIEKVVSNRSTARGAANAPITVSTIQIATTSLRWRRIV